MQTNFECAGGEGKAEQSASSKKEQWKGAKAGSERLLKMPSRLHHEGKDVSSTSCLVAFPVYAVNWQTAPIASVGYPIPQN